MSNSEKKLDEDMDEGKSKVAKRFFGLTFYGVRNNKETMKRKTSFLRKKKGNNNSPKMHNL